VGVGRTGSAFSGIAINAMPSAASYHKPMSTNSRTNEIARASSSRIAGEDAGDGP
jgi:hypothetical protein